MKTASKAAVASLKRNLKDIDERAPHRRSAARKMGIHSKNAPSLVSLGPNARLQAELNQIEPIEVGQPGISLIHEPGRKRRPTLNEAEALLLVPDQNQRGRQIHLPRLLSFPLFSSQVVSRSPGTGRSLGSTRNLIQSTRRFGGSIGAETMSVDRADQSYATTLRTEIYTSEDEVEPVNYYAHISNYRKKDVKRADATTDALAVPAAARRDGTRSSRPGSLLKMKQTTFFGGSSDASPKHGVETSDMQYHSPKEGQLEHGFGGLRHTSVQGIQSASAQRSGEASDRRKKPATKKAGTPGTREQEQQWPKEE